MRVLHISDNDGVAGAGRAAFRIHRALRDACGVDSHMLVEYKHSRDPTVHAACGMRGFPGRLLFAIRAEIDQLPLRLYRKRLSTPCVCGWLPRGLPRLVRRHTPDVIHLHWLGVFGSFRELPALKKPTLWSLHDTDPFTGGCCYPGECLKHAGGCGRCPQLRSGRDKDLSTWLLDKKRQAWKDWPVNVVGLSDWITGLSRKSTVFRTKKHSIVYNGVDVNAIAPVDPQRARKRLGLPLASRLVLFGAASLEDHRKGGDLLCDALHHLRGEWTDEIGLPEIVLFGRNADRMMAKIPLITHSLGYVQNAEHLSRIYSAADVVVVPSREDNCPQVPIESLACGTPVVAFNATGLKDLLEDGITGRLATPFEPSDLSLAIRDLLCMPETKRETMRVECRRIAVERFSIERTAKAYCDIYRSMCKDIEDWRRHHGPGCLAL